MHLRSARRLLAFSAATLVLHGAHALAGVGPCTTTITADVGLLSVTSGGVQTITISSTLADREFSIVGSFSGTTPSEPNLAYGGLLLANDRYLVQSYLGRSPFIPGGVPWAPGGHRITTNAQGLATQVIVVPPQVHTSLIGRTVRHGVFTPSHLDFLPYCGSNSVTLTFAP